jgi:Concanavalin A-like lectin/glucanases superfamily/Right handed beta helix region
MKRISLFSVVSMLVILVLNAAPGTRASAATAVPNPIHWWMFNEGSGTTSADSGSIGGATATLNGATWAPGENGGYSVRIPGDVGNDVTLPTSLPATFTLTFWANVSSLTGGNQFSNIAIGGENYLANGFRSGWTTAGQYTFWCGQDGGTDANPGSGDYSSESITTGNWHHYAITYDGITKNIYIDGSLSNGASGAVLCLPGSYNISLGDGIGGTFGALAAYDDVRIYNSALTASQVATIYQQAPTPTPAPTSSFTPTILNSTFIISGQSNVTYSGLQISTTSGNCLELLNSTNVTIENSNIGPCGTNNSSASSNGIYISGGSGNNIYDSYIHVQNLSSDGNDDHEGILVKGSNDTTIQGNVLAFNETNIEVNGGTSTGVMINGNFLLNQTGPFPRGQQVQTGANTSNVIIANNRELSCQISTCAHTGDVKCLMCNQSTLSGDSFIEAADQEDANNIYETTGTVGITGNWIEGGDSPSGQGILIDYESTANCAIENNVEKDTGHGCIGPYYGNGTISGNKCESMTDIDTNQNGMYLYSPYGAGTTGPWLVSTNYLSVLEGSGTACNPATASCGFNSYGADGSVSISGSGNIDDNYYPAASGGPGEGSAYAILNSIANTNPPPLIPPQPKNCVATSPYSTQTSLPPCG